MNRSITTLNAALTTVLKTTLKTALITSLGWLPVTGQAEIYRWVDENGKVHFSDNPRLTKKQDKPAEKVDIQFNHERNTIELPRVARLQPIPNNSDNARSVMLEHVSLNLEASKSTSGVDSNDGNYSHNGNNPKIGQAYKYTRDAARKALNLRHSDKRQLTALPCLPHGQLRENNARYIIKRTDFRKPFEAALVEHGYTVVGTQNKKFALQGIERGELSLAAEIVDIKLAFCGRDNASDVFGYTQNSTYLKVKWEVFDNLKRQVVLSTISEGSDDFINKPPRNSGAPVSNQNAFQQALENLLAQQAFADILQGNQSATSRDFVSATKVAPIDITYGDSSLAFIDQTDRIEQGAVTVRTALGHGSGFAIAPRYLISNAHVVGKSSNVMVVAAGREYPARVVRLNQQRDVALIELQGQGRLPALSVEPQPVRLGEEIYVVGTPLDERLNFSISRGIISAKRTMDDQQQYYQTDAAVNPGNSGGPVFNRHGNIIAVTVAGIFSRDGGSKNINYLIPIDDALSALKIAN